MEQQSKPNEVANAVEFALKHLARVEVVHCRAVAAGCDVFVDFAPWNGGVGHVGGGVEAFAEVEEVGGVEVLLLGEWVRVFSRYVVFL